MYRRRTDQVSILEAAHAADVLAVVQIIRTEHLLYWFYSLCEEAASPSMPSFAVLTRWGLSCWAFADDMAELVALIADGPLGTAVRLMLGRETIHAGGLFGAGIIMMADL